MEDRLALAKTRIRQAIPTLKFSSAIAGVLEIYRFATEGGSTRQLFGILCTLAAAVLTWMSTAQLRKGSKLALYFILGALAFGTFRWVVIDQSFAVTFPAILLLALFAWFVGRYVYWVRIGALK